MSPHGQMGTIAHKLFGRQSDPQKQIPFSSFFTYGSFSSSIGIGFSLGASIQAPDRRSSYAFATALFGGALTLGLAGQLALTSPRIKAGITGDTRAGAIAHACLASAAVISLAMVAVAMELIGYALISVSRGAGILSMVLTSFASIAALAFWITFQVVLDDLPEKTEAAGKDKEKSEHSGNLRHRRKDSSETAIPGGMG